MSSARSAPALDLELRPSARLAALVLGSHAAALLALAWPSQLPLLLRLPLAAAVFLSLARSWPEVRLRGVRAIRRLGWNGELGWWCTMGAAPPRPAELLAGAVLLPGLIVLRLRTGAGTRALVIPSDGAPPEALRRLRVHLRHGAHGGGADARARAARG